MCDGISWFSDITVNMKVAIVVLSLVAATIAGESAPKPQSGLLVLPKGSANVKAQPQSVESKNVNEVNAKLMETLKQKQWSEQGTYHVYLKDGRLQKVQYTTAPVNAQQQQAGSSNYKQQTPDILSPEFAEKRGVYFVQVPQERIQALQAQNQQLVNNNFQNSQASSRLQEATPVNVRYLPLEEPQNSFSGFSGQYRQEQTSDESTVRFLPISLGEDNTGPAAFRSQQQQEEPAGYYASLKYSPVQPIQGPVYSYKPEGLTRILRYAPVY